MTNIFRSLIIIGSLMAAFCSHAQVYTGSNFPVVGSNYPMFIDSSVGWDITEEMLLTPPPWYFLQSSYDYVDTVRFVNPSTTPFAAYFPNATIAVIDSFVSDFLPTTYLYQSAGDLYQLGGTVNPEAEVELPLVYQSPALWLNLPVQLGSSSVSTLLGEAFATGAQVGVPVDSVHLRRAVISHDTVDAVGLLTLPGLILDNAIRRIRTDSIQDSIFTKTNGVWSYDENINEGNSVEKYVEWYHADKDWLVAQAYVRNDQVSGLRYIPGPPPTVRMEFSSFPTDISILDTISSFQVSAINIATGQLVTNFADSIRVSTFQDTTNGWNNWFVDETAVVPISGVSTFTDLWFNHPGTYRLIAWSDTVLTDTSSIIIVHPVASYLELDITNANILENGLIPTLTVSALNDSGYVDDLFYEGIVRVGKISGLGELTGTIDQPLFDGVATFNDLRITRAGEHQLVFYTPINQHYLVQDTLVINVNPNTGDWVFSHTDTLTQYVDRAQEFVWFGNADGYLSGTSRGGYSEIGQHFDFQGRGRLTKLMCHFANRFHVGDDSDVFEIKVYDAGLLESTYASNQNVTTFMDSVPLTLLGSQFFLADSMNFGDFWIQRPTTIEFDNPPLITSSFVVSLVGDSELSNDTIMFWHSVPGNGQQEYRTVRLMNIFGNPLDPDTAWVRDKYWRPSFDVDLMMSPILDYDTLNTITGLITSSIPDINLVAFPNPTLSETLIEWNSNSEVYAVEIYIGAKRVSQEFVQSKNSVLLNLKRYPSGTFLLVLRNKEGLLIGTKRVIKQ